MKIVGVLENKSSNIKHTELYYQTPEVSSEHYLYIYFDIASLKRNQVNNGKEFDRLSDTFWSNYS